MAASNLHRLWLAPGVYGCAPRICPMGFECATCHFAWLLNAHHTSTDLRKNIHRISTHEERKSFRRFLGARLSHYGRYATTSATIGKRLHQANPHKTGIFSTSQKITSFSECHNMRGV